MKIKLSQLRKIISEEIKVVSLKKQPRNLGYGEGEGRMSKSQLFKVARYAQHLHDTLLDDDDLPEWVQSKISVMAHDIGKIKHYLEYKIKRMEEAAADEATTIAVTSPGSTVAPDSSTTEPMPGVYSGDHDEEDDDNLLQDQDS